MPVVNTSPISERIAGLGDGDRLPAGARWELAGHGVRVGVNLSPSQLQSGDLAQSVADVARDDGLTPSLLELEVTEDILLQDEERVLELSSASRSSASASCSTISAPAMRASAI